MPKIAIGDAEFYYELEGKGKPLVLIAGYACDHTVWMPIVGLLKEHFRVLTFDNRAVGQTVDSGKPLNVSLMAEDVIALTEALGLTHPHIVGQSMGGNIAQSIAARFGDKIDRLVLMATTFKWRKAVLLAMESLLDMRKSGAPFDFTFQSLLPWLFGENFLSNPQNIEHFKELLLQNPFPQSLVNQERQCAVLRSFEGKVQLSSIRAPTLIIHGEEDTLVLPYEAEEMKNLILHAQLTQLPCAHVMAAELPERLTRTLLSFLA